MDLQTGQSFTMSSAQPTSLGWHQRAKWPITTTEWREWFEVAAYFEAQKHPERSALDNWLAGMEDIAEKWEREHPESSIRGMKLPSDQR